MFLKYRPAQIADLEECLACVRDRFAYDAGGRRDLLAFWREGLTSGTLDMALMEDTDAPHGERVLYFVCKAGLVHEYAAHIHAGPPTLGRHVLERWCAGRSPVLPRAEVAVVNRGRGARGLTMATLHNGTPALYGRGDLAFVMKKMVEWAPFSTVGYRIDDYLIEGYGPVEWAWLEGAGLRLRRAWEPEELVPDWPPDKLPRLYGVTEVEARTGAGTMASLMFQWQPPCFGFTRPEQELLLYALDGDTDEYLAQSLHLAPITVRKRWEGIYARVAAARPDVFGLACEGDGPKRGGEKKRRLLGYLRHHMQELRPHDLSATLSRA